MARKTAVLKITAGAKIPKEWEWQLASLKRITPVEGTEGQYARFVGAVEARLKQQARHDQACDLHDEVGSNESRALMHTEGQELDKLIRREMQYLDAWRSTVKHINDAVAVPEDELRAIVVETVTANIGEIDFSLNTGLLGSKVAQAIRRDVTEAQLDAPLCAEHAL